MVDFTKKLGTKKVSAAIDPVALYDTLDRAVDKGPLRPAQEAVLVEWHSKRRGERDLIVKLHTGQGKTLIGLLMLQSRLNESAGPAVYLCPDNYLIAQTRTQAQQFGITTCVADPDLPDEFLNGRRILVTSVQKLFNGLTKFGLNRKSLPISTLLMDDAHACSDTVREACRIRLTRDEPAYDALLSLFAAELEQQGAGSYADITNEKYDAVLPVPYWAWIDHEADVARILSGNSARNSVKFAWPLIKDLLPHCQCVVSGAAIEIEPRVAPLDVFGSYWSAERRIFMSATVTDDAFLVKGLRLTPETITRPLTYEKERWSGEKMVLIPSLIDDSLNRTEIVHLFGRPSSDRKFGIVALAPSFKGTKDWAAYGASVANKDTLAEAIESLRQGQFDKAIVLVNRYDGVDLPDAMCRILVFDSRPYSESLVDLYEEGCRAESEATLMRTVRTVEQGLGRSVRGEKDYSVIVITGADITRLMRDRDSRSYLSSQMATQIAIGLEIADMARDDIQKGEDPKKALQGLVRQCLTRDAGWKAFYGEQMEAVVPSGSNERVLRLYAAELDAEQKHVMGDYGGAVETLQKALDDKLAEEADRGWYLQEMARYNYVGKRTESQRLQRLAFNRNKLLLRPAEGVTVTRITVVSHGRVDRIADWAKQFESYEQLNIAISDILTNLAFGVKATKFEAALDELARSLGFIGERPDKEWKEGPDNLWAVEDQQYILWECKSEVDTSRAEIHKDESHQMDKSCSWFAKYYEGAKVRQIIIIPTNKVASAAAFMHQVVVMRERELATLVRAVRTFFKSFESMNLRDLSPTEIQSLLDSHKLGVPHLLSEYATPARVRP